MVFEAGNSQTLGSLVVEKAASLAKEVRVVSCTHDASQEHGWIICLK